MKREVSMIFHKVAVIGAGAMGSGIAQVLSQAGLSVVVKDVEQAFVEKGLANIKRMYDSRVKKEVLTQDAADRLFANISTTIDNTGLHDVDLVIEAAKETIEAKLAIFKDLDKVCPEHAILATNTSALSISEIASATSRPDRVLGLHFFNPAQVMKLVEVIPGLLTSNDTVDKLLKFCRETLQKEPVKVVECPGFLVNRLLFPYLNEALYVLSEGHTNAADIDQAAVDFGLPMGPLTLLDMTGLDICAHVNNFLAGEYGARFETAPLLPKLVELGFLGQKSGAGIYLHPQGGKAAPGETKEINPRLEGLLREVNQDRLRPSVHQQNGAAFDVYRVIMPMFNEAIYALQENVVEASDIDPAMKNGTGLKRGLLTLAQEHGLAWCHEKLEQYRIAKGERFRSPWYLSKLVRAGLHDLTQASAIKSSIN
ncbi:unnamed protein product [Sphagnum balticum]